MTQTEVAGTTVRQQRILDAALDLFHRQGYPDTTVRQITEACDLTPGALYYHFPSKEDLLHALCAGAHQRVEAMIEDALAAADDDPVAQLSAVVRASVLFHTRHREEALVVNREYGSLPDPQREEIVEGRRRIRRFTERILQRGAAAGVFDLPKIRGNTAVKMAAMAIGEMAYSTADWFHVGGAVADDDLAELYVRYALRLAGADQ